MQGEPEPTQEASRNNINSEGLLAENTNASDQTLLNSSNG